MYYALLLYISLTMYVHMYIYMCTCTNYIVMYILRIYTYLTMYDGYVHSYDTDTERKKATGRTCGTFCV